jgi:hypothetical protein
MSHHQHEVVNESDARMAIIRDSLTSTIYRAKSTVQATTDPKARELLENTAEVLSGLVKAYQEYDRTAAHN